MTPTPAGTNAALLAEARLDLAARVAAQERVPGSVKAEALSQQVPAGWWGIRQN